MGGRNRLPPPAQAPPACRRASRSNGVPFHSEQSSNTSQKARMIGVDVVRAVLGRPAASRSPSRRRQDGRRPVEELTRVQVGGPGVQRRRRLAGDHVETFGGRLEPLPAVFEVKPDSRILERTLARGRSSRSSRRRRANLGDVDRGHAGQSRPARPWCRPRNRGRGRGGAGRGEPPAASRRIPHVAFPGYVRARHREPVGDQAV